MLYKKQISLLERKDLQLNGPGNYKVEDNTIYTRAIEINAVKHCNLSCRGCSHSSPLSPKQISDISIVKRDLEKLSKFMKCETIRVVGGEPLLHPEFNKLIKVIKESNICKNICLVTNGTLLHTLDDEALSNIEKIEISLYPLQETLVEKIKEEALKISKKGIKVRILEYSTFREAVSKEKTESEDLVKNIYETCQIAHFLRCITVDNGRVFRCPQSMVFSSEYNKYKDTCKIDELENINQLLEFLENNNPIEACYYCLGSIGNAFKHEQLNRNNWQDKLPNKPDDAIDNAYLSELLKDARQSSKCMERKYLN